MRPSVCVSSVRRKLYIWQSITCKKTSWKKKKKGVENYTLCWMNFNIVYMNVSAILCLLHAVVTVTKNNNKSLNVLWCMQFLYFHFHVRIFTQWLHTRYMFHLLKSSLGGIVNVKKRSQFDRLQPPPHFFFSLFKISLCKNSKTVRDQELCGSRGGHPGLPSPNSPYGLCGHEATWNLTRQQTYPGRSQ